jgi:hypothetical protein
MKIIYYDNNYNNIPTKRINYIYLICYELELFYVGQATDLMRRLDEHKKKNTNFINDKKTIVYLLEQNKNKQIIDLLEKVWIFYFQDYTKISNKVTYPSCRNIPIELIKLIDCNLNKLVPNLFFKNGGWEMTYDNLLNIIKIFNYRELMILFFNRYSNCHNDIIKKFRINYIPVHKELLKKTRRRRA